jgi:hypothetical protein
MARGQRRQATLPTLEPFDGHAVDKLEVRFTGRVALDPDDPKHRELYNDLKLGKEVTCTVQGAVVARPHEANLDAEGFVSSVVGACGVRVHSIEGAARTRSHLRPVPDERSLDEAIPPVPEQPVEPPLPGTDPDAPPVDEVP